ncbi:hypothetical protein DXG03_006486 [Asterophora parasitica]|uniref:Uncharacterized protein n=1 Tax=Asterophora parasitica TaxID=117018 RepID=A0A9P7GE23_9AGAR|nr:hypothetical protein DXG03_006486 [Asterophora parasitica]
MLPTTQRVLPRRNHSFPLPSRPNIDNDMLAPSQSNDAENPPSLVSQLQQVHGLTKKKVYGTKPARKPFFRAERVLKEGPGAVAPLLPNARTSPRSSSTGRALSNSRTARINRVAQSSPTDIQPRLPALPRRNSQMSSPDTDRYPSPIPFSVPSDLSPVPQLYSQPPPVAPISHVDSSWDVAQYKLPLNRSSSQLSPYSLTPSQPLLTTPWQNNASDVSRPLHSVAGPYTTSLHRPISLELGTKAQAPSSVEKTPPHHLSAPRRASRPEDEEPFTFPAEYVAATATMYKHEVLATYPGGLEPAFEEVISPRRAFFIAQDQGSVPPSPSSSYDPGELYVATERDDILQQHPSSFPLELSLDYPTVITDSPELSYATSYSPGSSSSLKGWAG